VKSRVPKLLLPFSSKKLKRLSGRSTQELERLLEEKTAEFEEAKAKLNLQETTKLEFLARVSHEMRTPLNGVIGMTELTLEQIEDTDCRAMLEDSLASSKLLLAILNDMLDLSRIESGKLLLEHRPFSPKDVTNKVINIVNHSADTKNRAPITFFCGPEVPSLIYGDSLRFGQILLNLITNASKFTPSTGNITVVISSSEENILSVVVEDTGIGIPKEIQLKIFEPFLQADSGNSRRSGGSGLGLSICQQLTKLMNGEIILNSEAGEGTRFTVLIPFQEVNTKGLAQPEIERVRARAPSLWRKRVLIAEDNQVNQRLMIKLLQRFGVVTTIANNGEEAVEKAMAERFDLILMDCSMPHVDGYEATEQIREKLTYRVPIVAITANAMESCKEQCIAAGMDEFMTKPVDREELAKLLMKYLAAGPTNPQDVYDTLRKRGGIY